jgi:hypothetical protein
MEGLAMPQGNKDGFVAGERSSSRGHATRSSLAIAAVFASLILAACGPSPQRSNSASPAVSASSASAQPPSGPSSSPDGASLIDDPAYLAGDPFLLPVGDAGTDWIAPSSAPVVPNGQQAVRVAFVPASCVTDPDAAVKIEADRPPDDDWETSLQGESSTHAYEIQSWPGAREPTCANGQGSTYLQVAYRPLVPGGAIHLTASSIGAGTPPTELLVLPVFTNADASQPALTMDGSVALEPVAGPAKPRSTKAQALLGTDFTAATLPDGSAPTHWDWQVTGCGQIGRTPIVITARIGDAAPMAVGGCSEGSGTFDMSTWPLPPDGTHISLLITGGTTKSLLRVSEFQWRGDRP